MLSSLNSIIIEGNLTADPVIKTTQNGHNVTTFSIASNRFYKNKDEEQEKEVSYFEIETWSRLAQTCGEVLKKGRGVRVVGRLKQDRWTDAEGKARSKIIVVAEHVEFKPVFKKPESTMEQDEEEEIVAEI